MKYLAILFLVMSCASSPKIENEEPVFIEMSVYKNGTKIDTARLITNLNIEAEIKKEKKGSTTSFKATPKKGKMKGKDGIFLKTNTSHTSTKFGEIEFKNELFLTLDKMAKFDITDDGQKVAIEVVVRKVDSSPSAKDKVCMATIYESQHAYRKKHGDFATSWNEIKKSTKCPKDLNLTMAKTGKDSFIAIGVFAKNIWVINQDKYMIEAKNQH